MTLMTYTYLIEAKSGEVKIGRSDMPFERVKEIAMRSPCEVRLIAVWRAPHCEEYDLHQRFAPYRQYREWFRNEGLLAEFVAEKFGAGLFHVAHWGSPFCDDAAARKATRAKRHSAAMRAKLPAPAKQEDAAA